jgi:hypothetical protein
VAVLSLNLGNEESNMSNELSITINDQQRQALTICVQLLDSGTFSIAGRDLQVATQAKILLSQVAQLADEAAKPAGLEMQSKPAASE